MGLASISRTLSYFLGGLLCVLTCGLVTRWDCVGDIRAVGEGSPSSKKHGHDLERGDRSPSLQYRTAPVRGTHSVDVQALTGGGADTTWSPAGTLNEPLLGMWDLGRQTIGLYADSITALEKKVRRAYVDEF